MMEAVQIKNRKLKKKKNGNVIEWKYNYNQKKRKRMQVYNSYSPQFQINQTSLQRIISLPNIQQQICYISTSGSQSGQDNWWRCTVKWILKLKKKNYCAKSSLYLAVSYLWKLVKLGYNLTEENYEKIAATLVLMSTKMNQIYPPKMSQLISKCSKKLTKDEMISLEGWILSVFNFDMSFEEITYSKLCQMLGEECIDKLEDSEKLLGLAVTQKQIMRAGEEMVALGVIYLIRPSLIKQYTGENIQKIRVVASKIYNLYVINKGNKN